MSRRVSKLGLWVCLVVACCIAAAALVLYAGARLFPNPASRRPGEFVLSARSADVSVSAPSANDQVFPQCVRALAGLSSAGGQHVNIENVGLGRSVIEVSIKWYGLAQRRPTAWLKSAEIRVLAARPVPAAAFAVCSNAIAPTGPIRGSALSLPASAATYLPASFGSDLTDSGNAYVTVLPPVPRRPTAMAYIWMITVYSPFALDSDQASSQPFLTLAPAK